MTQSELGAFGRAESEFAAYKDRHPLDAQIKAAYLFYLSRMKVMKPAELEGVRKVRDEVSPQATRIETEHINTDDESHYVVERFIPGVVTQITGIAYDRQDNPNQITTFRATLRPTGDHVLKTSQYDRTRRAMRVMMFGTAKDQPFAFVQTFVGLDPRIEAAYALIEQAYALQGEQFNEGKLLPIRFGGGLHMSPNYSPDVPLPDAIQVTQPEVVFKDAELNAMAALGYIPYAFDRGQTQNDKLSGQYNHFHTPLSIPVTDISIGRLPLFGIIEG